MSDESGSESSDEEQREIEAKPLKPTASKKALMKSYESFKLDLDWFERLDLINTTDVVVPEFSLQIDKNDGTADDDFKREIKFFKQAQSAVLQALPKLNELNTKTKRPEDYYAQMAKSDDHMKRVRKRLQAQEIVMERREKAKKLRELKKYAKQVQQQATEKHRKEKKEILEKLKKRRKLGKNSDDIFDAEIGKANGNRKNEANLKRNIKPTSKRLDKDKKYGFGGKKKRSKYNTAQSSANISEFRKPKTKKKNPHKFQSKKMGKTNRAGKQKRQMINNRKNRNKKN